MREQARVETNQSERVVGELPEMLVRNTLRLNGDMAVNLGAAESTLRLQQVIATGTRGVFDQNNGVIAFLTGRGEYRVAPYSEDLSEALRAAGYREGGLFVALSNGELPAQVAMRTEWLRMNEDVKELRRARFEECALTTYLSEAAVSGIVHGVASRGDFWCVDNVAYRGSAQGPVANLPGRFADVSLRAQLIGRYDTNNGLLAFVDESGATFIGRSCQQNLDTLNAAGYRSGSIFVPFSNGEQPATEAHRTRLDAIRATPPAW